MTFGNENDPSGLGQYVNSVLNEARVDIHNINWNGQNDIDIPLHGGKYDGSHIILEDYLDLTHGQRGSDGKLDGIRILRAADGATLSLMDINQDGKLDEADMRQRVDSNGDGRYDVIYDLKITNHTSDTNQEYQALQVTQDYIYDTPAGWGLWSQPNHVKAIEVDYPMDSKKPTLIGSIEGTLFSDSIGQDKWDVIKQFILENPKQVIFDTATPKGIYDTLEYTLNQPIPTEVTPGEKS